MLAAGVFAVLLTPMLSTAYYNTSASLIACGDIGLRSQRQIAGKVVAGQIGAFEPCIHAAIGDTLNAATRREELTKDVGQHILINRAHGAGSRNRPAIVAIFMRSAA